MRSPGPVATSVLAALLLSQLQVNAGESPKQGSSEESSGMISGLIKFNGEIPKSPVADDGGMRRDLIQVDPATRGLQNVVASVVPGKARPRAMPNAAMSGGRARMDQREYAFVPKVMAVAEGEPVVFTNSDPANHNIRAASALKSNEFNIYLGEGNEHEHRFVAHARPVRLGCDIHPWMQGWVYVFDHPLFSVSDRRGKFLIGPLPPGEYTLRLEQPDIRFKKEQKINVRPGKPIMVEIALQAGKVPNSGLADQATEDD